MMHFPLREDQLDVVAFLKPSLQKLQKPPLLRFGWIVRDEEIIAIAKKKNIGPITLEDYLFPGEPGYPEGQEPDEYGGTTVTTTEYHPMYTGDRLLKKAKEELSLKVFPPDLTLKCVGHGLFDSSSSWFIELYTTMDTLPGRCMAPLSAERATMLSDRPEFKHAVEKLQKWLELDDREPGWCVCACANNWISWYEWQRRGQSHC